jgi:hypothetical protein
MKHYALHNGTLGIGGYVIKQDGLGSGIHGERRNAHNFFKGNIFNKVLRYKGIDE